MKEPGRLEKGVCGVATRPELKLVGAIGVRGPGDRIGITWLSEVGWRTNGVGLGW